MASVWESCMVAMTDGKLRGKVTVPESSVAESPDDDSMSWVLPGHPPSEVLFTDVLHGPMHSRKLRMEHAASPYLECSCHCTGSEWR